MITPADEFVRVIIPFQKLFSKPVFRHVQLLLMGAVLAPGKRTVSSVLRIVGLKAEKNFHKYHRVLSLVEWSALEAAQILLKLLLACFLPVGPVIVGIDETLERRWGQKIAQRGIYRDSVRSSGSHFVKSSGLRWISVMLLVPVSWAKRVWALPFLTVLAPSERYYQRLGKGHKKLTDWARQMLLQVKRWLPDGQVIAVGDSSYAVIDLLAALKGKVTFITRLGVDAALYEPAPTHYEPAPTHYEPAPTHYEPAPTQKQGQKGRPAKKGKRLPTLEQLAESPHTQWQEVVFSEWYGQNQKAMLIATGTAWWYHSGKEALPIRWVLLGDPAGKLKTTALLCTHESFTALQIVTLFVRRWAIEVTLQEVRAHLGVETQRQWSHNAIARTTPVLLALFSLVALLADRLQAKGKLIVSTAAWYDKQRPTFSDAIASVRSLLWTDSSFSMSAAETHTIKIPRQLLLLFQQALAWVA